MNKNFKAHKCHLMPETGVYISFTFEQDSTWILTIQREATEQDVEDNHYLEDIGDIIWMTELEIRCCPYCGEVLEELAGAKKPVLGEFQHLDCSSWSSKVM